MIRKVHVKHTCVSESMAKEKIPASPLKEHMWYL